MEEDQGDFIYNGVPIYEANLNDFIIISHSFNTGNRILTRNIKDERLKTKLKKSGGHGHNFGIRFEGIILDLRDLKNNNVEE